MAIWLWMFRTRRSRALRSRNTVESGLRNGESQTMTLNPIPCSLAAMAAGSGNRFRQNSKFP